MLTKNNLLIYYSPVTTLGGENDVQSVASICANFSYVVISKHVGSDLTNLQAVKDAVKKVSPNTKWFGYTTLGGSADYPTWLASMNQWATDLPSPFTLDGIFIDQAGPDYTLSTRANLNSAITAIRATASPSSFVNAWVLGEAFGNVAGAAASVIGNSATQDYVLLESYWQNVNDASLEDAQHRVARAEYAQWMQANLKVLAMGVLGAGTLTSVDAGVWKSVRDELNSYGIVNLGVGPSDFGSTSHLYFLTNASNTVDPFIPNVVGPSVDYATVASTLEYLQNVDMSSMGTGATLLAAQQVSVSNATSYVDRFCRRSFQAATKQVKAYSGNGKQALRVDDLLSVSGITETNLAGVTQATDLTKVLLMPLNAGGPYTWLSKKQTTLNPNPDVVIPATWAQGQGNVSVTGVFGYASAVPADVVQAASMLAAAEILLRVSSDQALTHGASSVLQGIAHYEFFPPRGRSPYAGAYAADIARLVEQARTLLRPYRRTVLAY